MILSSDLQDKMTLIESHTQEGLDNLTKFQDFLKRRAQAESKYAKELQSISESYRIEASHQAAAAAKPKKKKDDKPTDSPAGSPKQVESDSSHRAWEVALEQTEVSAKIHANISNQLETELVLTIKNQLKHFETERKQGLADVTALKQDLKIVYDTHAKVKKSYEASCKEADTAASIAAKAKNDMNVTKAYEEKVNQDAAVKAKKAEEADEEYKKSLTDTNAKKDQHYNVDLPKAINKLQGFETARVDFYKAIMLKYAGVQFQAFPEESESVQKLIDAVHNVAAATDCQIFIKNNMSGVPKPPAIPYENYWEALKAEARRKKKPEDEELDSLPADKAKKKAQSKLKEIEKELHDAESKRSGIEMLAETYIAQPQLADPKALADINNQLEAVELKIDTLKLRKYRYDSVVAGANKKPLPDMPHLYLDDDNETGAADLRAQILGAGRQTSFMMSSASLPPVQTGTSTNNNSNASVASNTSGASPTKKAGKFALFTGGNSKPIKENSVTEVQSPSILGERVKATYEFKASGENELSMADNEILIVVERGDSGWVKVRNSEGQEGYVPENYIEEEVASPSS
eukprot:Partr_v1_DN27304_c0_g1_i1_m46170 putative formin binding protein